MNKITVNFLLKNGWIWIKDKDGKDVKDTLLFYFPKYNCPMYFDTSKLKEMTSEESGNETGDVRERRPRFADGPHPAR